MKGQGFVDRLRYAWSGLRSAWLTEKSLRAHLVVAGLTMGLAALCQANAVWWAILCLTMALVLASELLNTAIETLADHLHPSQHPAIKVTKDVAAAAVLMASMGALGVGVFFLVDQVLPWLKKL